MNDASSPVLPYRCDLEALFRFLRGREGGASSAELRADLSPKGYEGATVCAQALGLTDPRTGTVTKPGSQLANAPAEERPAQLLRAMRDYPAYAELIAELERNGPETVTLDWIREWWAQRGYGSSESNRVEAAPAFARLASAAGLGAFVPGRKGRPSRIELVRSGLRPVTRQRGARIVARSRSRRDTFQPGARHALRTEEPPTSRDADAPRFGNLTTAAAGRGRSVLRWEITSGKLVSVELPADLSRPERTRLLRVLELLLGD